MTQTIPRSQRHSKEHPCRICGGWDGLGAPRGKGQRCWGYLSTDGKYEHCVRDELAGGLPQEPRSGTYAHRLEGPCKCGSTHGDAPVSYPAASSAQHRDPKPANVSQPPPNGRGNGHGGPNGHGEPRFREVASWEYEGGLIVARAETDDGEKTFWQRHRLADGTVVKGAGPEVPRTLLYAAEVRAAKEDAFIWLVEGEKCADALRRLGFIATTAPGGSKNWASAAERAAELLKRRHVVILPDADEPGRKLAAGEQATLERICASLRVLELPGLSDGEDVVEWLERGGDPEDLWRMAELRPDLGAKFHPRTIEQILSSDLFSAPQQTFSTGFAKLDELLDGGVKARQVTAIAAPTGAGKSALALNLARVLCTQRPVLYVTTELEPEEIAARAAGPLIGARASDLLALRADPLRAAAAVKGWPIYPFEVEDDADGDVSPLERVRLQIQTLRDFTGVMPIVLVDYLQELAPEDAERRRGAVARVVKRLRLFARKMDTAVIAISSVNRALYGPGSKKLMADESDPRAWLASAKESGDIEYAAAAFIYLDTDTKVNAMGESAARLIVAKSRRGRVGFVGLRFHGPTGRFYEAEDALDEMGSEKRITELENRIIEAVRIAKAPKTKDELAKLVKGTKAENGRVIERLVEETRLATKETRRMNASNKLRKVFVITIPSDETDPEEPQMELPS